MKFNKLVIVALSSASLFLFACAGGKPTDKKNDEQKVVDFSDAGTFGITKVTYPTGHILNSQLDTLKDFAALPDGLRIEVTSDTTADIEFHEPGCVTFIPAKISSPSTNQIEITINSAVAFHAGTSCFGNAPVFAAAMEPALNGVFTYSFTGNDFTMSPVADNTIVISGSKK